MARPKKQPEVVEEVKPTEVEVTPVEENDTVELSIDDLKQIIAENDPKRHTVFFDDIIRLETVQELIDTLSQHDYIDLYFSTDGGEVASMEVLLHYLNRRKYEIKIFLTIGVASAGTMLLTDFQGEIEPADNLVYLMIHKVDFMSYRNRKDGALVRNLDKGVKRMNKELYKKYKLVGFSDKHLKGFKEGKDVFVYRGYFKKLKFGMFFEPFDEDVNFPIEEV